MKTLWRNAFFHVYLSATLVTAAEIFLKIGADETAHIPSSWAWLGLNGLVSYWVWLGIIGTLASLWSWLYALRTVPLNVAFLLSNIVHVTVPVSSWLFLHEAIGTRRWAGIALVLLGVLLVRQTLRQNRGSSVSLHLKLLGLILLSQVSYVLGEFLYKQAMAETRVGWSARSPFLISGFLAQALSFFLWLGLLNEAELSYLFPFQSLNVLAITLGAAIFLKEKLNWQLIGGMLLIASGVALVFGS